jgi:hypothetical protein
MIYIYGHLHLKTLALTPKDSKKNKLRVMDIYIYIHRLYNLVYIRYCSCMICMSPITTWISSSLRQATQRVYVGCSQIHGGLSSGAPLGVEHLENVWKILG